MWTCNFSWLHLTWLWCYHADNNTSFTRVDGNDWHCVAVILNLKWMWTRGIKWGTNSPSSTVLHNSLVPASWLWPCSSSSFCFFFHLSNTHVKFHECILHSWKISVLRQTNKHLTKYSNSFCGCPTTIYVSRTRCQVASQREKKCHGTQLL